MIEFLKKYNIKYSHNFYDNNNIIKYSFNYVYNNNKVIIHFNDIEIIFYKNKNKKIELSYFYKFNNNREKCCTFYFNNKNSLLDFIENNFIKYY